MKTKTATSSETARVFDRDDLPILGANPFVGLTREQVVAALARLAQRVAVEPGTAAATAVDALAELLRIGVGRSDVAAARGDRRFVDAAWQGNPPSTRILLRDIPTSRSALSSIRRPRSM